MFGKISTDFCKKSQHNEMKKIVIRRLPPDLDLATFKRIVSPLPEHDYIYFVRADNSYGKYSFSRAYINFIYEDDLYIFKEKFDGYIFLSFRGIKLCIYLIRTVTYFE